ncbi:MAG: helix-turn-helix domain-containing protein [Lentisphaeria bacterium]|nr:helix-turn-helix domain-containing protein [Lentisphaeria bacterium]
MIKVVPKILQLLELFADGREYTFSAVISATSLSRSNASHLLDSLVEEKILVRTARGVYRRGERLLRLSGSDPFAGFRRIARNGALLLMDQLDELAVVAVRRGIFRTTVEKLQPPRLLQVAENPSPGYPADWYGTGNGRVLLAFAPRETVVEIVRHCGLPSGKIWKEAVTLPKLERELERIRENNFCTMTLDNEIRVAAVPVPDAEGVKAAALSTAFPLFRRHISEETLLEKLRHVSACMEKEFQSAGIRFSDLE